MVSLACAWLCVCAPIAVGLGTAWSFRSDVIRVAARVDEPQWQADLAVFDEALAADDMATARTAVRALLISADKSRHWEAFAALASAQLRLGRVAGLPGLSRDGARQNYLLALHRAREQRSQDGIRTVSAALTELDHCLPAGD